MRLQTAGLMLVVMHARALLAPNGRRVFADAVCRCSFSQRLRTLAASRDDLEGLTVPVLKDRLRAQGLKVGGKKAELVERLLESAPVPAAPAASAAPAPAAPAASATPAPVKQTKPRRGDGRPHANPHTAERCEAEIVSFGPLGASVVVEFRDGRFGEGLVLQKELQYLRESRRGAGAEMGEMVSAFAAPSPTVEGKYDVFLRPPSAEGKNRDAAALIPVWKSNFRRPRHRRDVVYTQADPGRARAAGRQDRRRRQVVAGRDLGGAPRPLEVRLQERRRQPVPREEGRAGAARGAAGGVIVCGY